ncbi:hypothetical protein B0H13DRAFT_1599720 [Mycena leptocephala]|nr:hypothetical protein B0H13DRAFT_1599720 [Mycena leptocephala]
MSNNLVSYCQVGKTGLRVSVPIVRRVTSGCASILARPLGTQSLRTQHAGKFTKTLRDSDKEIIKRVEKFTEKHSLKMSQVALRGRAHKRQALLLASIR